LSRAGAALRRRGRAAVPDAPRPRALPPALVALQPRHSAAPICRAPGLLGRRSRRALFCAGATPRLRLPARAELLRLAGVRPALRRRLRRVAALSAAGELRVDPGAAAAGCDPDR